MSGRRSRNIRRAARLVIQGDKEAAAALEMLGATWKEVRRAGRMSMRKIAKAAGKIKSAVALPAPDKVMDVYEEGFSPTEPKTNE